MSRILWCITGAGGKLRSVFKAFLKFRREHPDVDVGVALSKAGEEVARIYGVLDRLGEVVSSGKYGGIYRDVSWSGITRDGVPLGGRISLHRYDVVVIAPASSNTVAKITHGISDTLPTIAANQALKSKTPLIILPADCTAGLAALPCLINEHKCTRCLICLDDCPYEAIYTLPNGDVRIDYNKCRGCGACEESCTYGAIRCWEKVRISPSPIDLKNLAELRRVSGIYIVESSEELIRKLKVLLKD